MKLRLFSPEEIAETVPMVDAISAMKDAFAAFSSGRTDTPQRIALSREGNVTLLMGAALEDRALAAKIVSVFPGNGAKGLPVVNGLVVILDPGTGRPAALCEGGFFTAWRTGAASGAATDLLAVSGAARAGLVGLGAQGRTQLLAVDAVRPLEEVLLYSRSPDRAARFVSEMQPRVKARLRAVSSADEVASGAQILCLATDSRTPVFDGKRLNPGTHLNGVGSFNQEMRECDGETVRRSRIFVDSRKAALAEAGDLVLAMTEGGALPDEWTEIGAVASGEDPGRRDEAEITFFKSVGLAVQDAALAALLVDRAGRGGSGREVEI